MLVSAISFEGWICGVTITVACMHIMRCYYCMQPCIFHTVLLYDIIMHWIILYIIYRIDDSLSLLVTCTIVATASYSVPQFRTVVLTPKFWFLFIAVKVLKGCWSTGSKLVAYSTFAMKVHRYLTTDDFFQSCIILYVKMIDRLMAPKVFFFVKRSTITLLIRHTPM